MTVPNVTITWCQRRAKCEWCPDHIEVATPMVTVFFWNKGSEERKGFNVKKYYHPQCWVAQGMDYLERNPYFTPIKKKRLELTPEESKHRYVLLRRKAAIDQRKRTLEDRPNVEAKVAALDEKIAELMIEIAPIGGIPKRWLEL